MFRTALLATTALVVGTTVGMAAGLHHQRSLPSGSIAVMSHNGHPVTVMLTGMGRQGVAHNNGKVEPVKEPGKMFSNLSKDANAQFISFYGWYTYNYYFSASTYSESAYQHAALPVTGDGGTHKKISVPIYQYSFASNQYTAGIYSDSGGQPGALIGNAATLSANPSAGSLCCTQLVTGSIGKTVVPAGPAWLVVSGNAQPGCQCEDYGLWLMENTNFTVHGGGMEYAYGDHFHTSGGYNTTYNSGWLSSSSGAPAGGAASIK